ncbi:MAG: uncharacterized protein A8A55_0398 [Amphiamblys sp. WSBS2006]|nr:MAG: uncharacterized protein A8A55_0398 [Amphiamblys sp. WSBS2006]
MVGEFGETEYFGQVPSMILDSFEARVWGALCESVGGLKKDLESIGFDTARVFGVYAEYVEDVFVKNMKAFQMYILSQVTKLPEAVCVSKTALCLKPREEYTEKRLQEVHGEVEEVVKRADAVMQVNRMLEDEARETNSETVFFDQIEGLILPLYRNIVSQESMSHIEGKVGEMKAELERGIANFRAHRGSISSRSQSGARAGRPSKSGADKENMLEERGPEIAVEKERGWKGVEQLEEMADVGYMAELEKKLGESTQGE